MWGLGCGGLIELCKAPMWVHKWAVHSCNVDEMAYRFESPV